MVKSYAGAQRPGSPLKAALLQRPLVVASPFSLAGPGLQKESCKPSGGSWSQRSLRSHEKEKGKLSGFFFSLGCYWGCVRVCTRVLLEIEPEICTLGRCLNVALSGAEGATSPGKSSGPTTPPEAPPTRQEAPPLRGPAHSRLRPAPSRR